MILFRAVCILSFYLFIACKPKGPILEKNQLNKEQLYGQWMIQDAMRNNRPTQTVNGAVVIVDSLLIKHNIFGSDGEFTYQVKDSVITTSDQSMFKVEFLNDTLLMMNTLIQNYKFRFSLKKQSLIENRPIDSLSEVQ